MKGRKGARRRSRGKEMVVVSARLPAAGLRRGPRAGRRPVGERRWAEAERAALAALERDIERGWRVSEAGRVVGAGPNEAWTDAWRGLVALVGRPSGPSFDDVAAASERVERFVTAFIGQLAMVVGLPPTQGHGVVPAWSECLLEVTESLLGPLSSWFPAERSEHQRLHAMALLRLGRRPEAARFIDRWRESSPGDVFAWLATSRLHCEPLLGGAESPDAARQASDVLLRGLQHCPDLLGRSLLWAELHGVYDVLGDIPRREATWDKLMRLVY
ncbi:MAG: hypothetical protein EP329_08975 [Deltaproteobacteria bacterium]|nr:MAG: hypothetical protein EP329_08975 [Deltaproteobacteria bacterium]